MTVDVIEFSDCHCFGVDDVFQNIARTNAWKLIDITDKKTQSVAQLLQAQKRYDYVITVCDEASAERCPVFPGGTKLHWGFTDPSQFTGTDQEKLQKVRAVKQEIKNKIVSWLNSV